MKLSQSFFPFSKMDDSSKIMTTKKDYFSPEDVSQLVSGGSKNDLSMIHLNAVSLLANFDTISHFVEGLNFPDIICISETRLKNEKIDWQLQLVGLPHYDLHYDNSPSNAGGVAIYTKTSLKCLVKTETRINIEDCESLFLEISIPSDSSNVNSKIKSLIVGCIYRHPRPTTCRFIEELCNKLMFFSAKNIPVVVMGDINIDVSKTSDKTVQYYINTLSSVGCENFINLYTRISGSSKAAWILFYLMLKALI